MSTGFDTWLRIRIRIAGVTADIFFCGATVYQFVVLQFQLSFGFGRICKRLVKQRVFVRSSALVLRTSLPLGLKPIETRTGSAAFSFIDV